MAGTPEKVCFYHTDSYLALPLSDRHTGRGRVSAEAEAGRMQLHAQECKKPAEPCPGASRGSAALRHLELRLLHSRTGREQTFLLRAAQPAALCYRRPGKSVRQGRRVAPGSSCRASQPQLVCSSMVSTETSPFNLAGFTSCLRFLLTFLSIKLGNFLRRQGKGSWP